MVHALLAKEEYVHIPKQRTCSTCGAILKGSHTWCKHCNTSLAPEKNDSEPERECPFCAELIKTKAIKCKHCGSEVEPLPEKQRPVAKKIIQETQVSKSAPIIIQPSKSEKPESSPPKKKFAFLVKESFWVCLLFVVGLSFAAYRELTPDQKASSTHKAKVIQNDINSENMNVDKKLELARKNIAILESKLKEKQTSEDIKKLREYYLLLITYDYKNTDKDAYNKAKKMYEGAIETELYEKVKQIPSSNIYANIKGYKELLDLNPNNKLYKDKLAHYEKKKPKSYALNHSSKSNVRTNNAGDGNCLKAFGLGVEAAERGAAAIQAGNVCLSADELETALNWLGTAEIECAKNPQASREVKSLINKFTPIFARAIQECGH